MGLFDNITCKVPLPVTEEEGGDFDLTQHEWENKTFQTKDLICALTDYEIREDGLWRRDVEYEMRELTKEEKKDQKKSGLWYPGWYTEEKSSEWRKEDYTGYVVFYDFVAGDGEEDLWVDFRAHFILGELQGIELERWEKESNKKRKEVSQKLKEKMKARAAFTSKWYFAVFCSPWNYIVRKIFRTLSKIASFFHNNLWKIERWLTF